MGPYNGYQVASVVDMANHPGAGNAVGTDGAGRTFRYTSADAHQFPGEYDGVIWLPKTHAAVRMRQCVSVGASWTDGLFTLGMSQVQVCDPAAASYSWGWFSAGVWNLSQAADRLLFGY